MTFALSLTSCAKTPRLTSLLNNSMLENANCWSWSGGDHAIEKFNSFVENHVIS